MYHPERNEWWLCASTCEEDHMDAWKIMIAESGGAFADPIHVLYHNKYSAMFNTLFKSGINKAKELKERGFVTMAGGFHQLSPAGTVWLRDKPENWWFMHSASIAQLQILKSLDCGSDIILETLVRKKWFEGTPPSSKNKGPSIIEHRWQSIFPEEMAFAHQCQLLGIRNEQVRSLWSTTRPAFAVQ